MKWRVVQASARGISHERSGAVCQDACYAEAFVNADGKEYLICLVSDGAGSAKKSDVGADIACVAAFRSIKGYLHGMATRSKRKSPKVQFASSLRFHRIRDRSWLMWRKSRILQQIGSKHDRGILQGIDRNAVSEWVWGVREAIKARAVGDGNQERDYACTLLCAIISSDSAVFFQIGDGAIIASTKQCAGMVFWPENGEYFNETYFITGNNVNDHIQFCRTVSSIKQVCLITDGLEPVALSLAAKVPYWPFFEPMLSAMAKVSPECCDAYNEQLAAFLNSPKVNERTDDDKTLVMATRV